MNPDQMLAQAREHMTASRFAEAAAAFEQLLKMVGDHPLVKSELAMVYTQINRPDEAEALARGALRTVPNLGTAEAALGLAALARSRPDLAIPHLQRAVELAPDLQIARQMLGISYGNLGRRREALACFETVCFLQPGHTNARFSLALNALYNRDYARGWHEYEWRWLTGQLNRPEIPRPRWDGRDLDGVTILVHTEQGIGDAVQLVRLMPLLKSQKRAAKIVFACQKGIHKLLADLEYVDDWFPIDQPAAVNFDTYTPMLSLPWLLDINEHNLPKQVPYIPVDPARTAKWKPIVDALPGFKIGIGWQGSPTYIGDAFRSIPLRYFEKLARISGVTLVSLQGVNGLEQIAANKGNVPLVELNGLDADGAFVDTAAVLTQLDLVVSCDSALIHIAGALGAPSLLGLSTGHDWRWQAGREDSPWYPTVRVFRQTAFQDWDGVFDRMAAVVQEGMKVRAALKPPRARLGEEPLIVEIQVGELFDKISILELKASRLQEPARRENVLKELAALAAVRDQRVPASPKLTELVRQLDEVNLAIWDNEERMREWAKAGDSGPDFIAGSRSIAKNNDRRAAIKREINDLLGSRLIEEKSFSP